MLEVFLLNLLKGYLLNKAAEKVKLILNFNESNYSKILKGKRTTIRLGFKNYQPGTVIIQHDGKADCPLDLYIKKIKLKKFKHLTQQDAINDGFKNLAQLQTELEECYGRTILPNDKVTHIFLADF